MPKSDVKFIPIQNKSVILHLCFVLFIVCLYICVCELLLQKNNHKTKHKNNTPSKQHSWVRGPLRECHSIRSCASGLPYYCAPFVCISVVIELLSVWRHNKSKTKNKYQTNLNNRKSQRMGFFSQKRMIFGSKTKNSRQIFATVEFKPSFHEHFQLRLNSKDRSTQGAETEQTNLPLWSRAGIRSIFGNTCVYKPFWKVRDLYSRAFL